MSECSNLLSNEKESVAEFVNRECAYSDTLPYALR